MSLPAGMRKRLGLYSGGAVFIEETPKGAVMRTGAQVVAHAKALAKRYASVDDGSFDDVIAVRAVEIWR